MPAGLVQSAASLSSGPQKLPPGWRMAHFGDVVQDVNETVRDPIAAGLERFVGLEHLEPETLHIRQWGLLADTNVTFKKRFRKGQVLFGKRRAYQRKVAVADFDGICSSDILTFQPKGDDLLPELLPFIVQSQGFFQHAIGTSSGSLSPRTRWSQLREYGFLLPPKGEQRRITEMLWAVNEAVGAALNTLSCSATFRSAVLCKTLRFGVGNAQLKTTPLGEIPVTWQATRVGNAGEVLLGRQRSPKYQSGKFTRPYLRVANVFDNFLDLSDVLQMDFDERDADRFGLRAGDILLNEGQSRELVGRCAMYNEEIPGCCFQNTLVRFRAAANLLPRFALYYFQHAFHTGVFASIASQTTAIAHLGAGRFADLHMPVPPIHEQEAIVMKLDLVDRSHSAIAENYRRLRSLAVATSEHLMMGRLP